MAQLLNRQQELLAYLLKCTEPVAGKNLAAALQVSDRTIRQDVKVINRLLDSIQATPHGYILAAAQRECVRELLEQSQPLSEPQDRLQYIVKRLLLARQALDIYDLAEELHISEPTLEKDIRQLGERLQQNNQQVRVQKQGRYLQLDGSEQGKRMLLSHLLAEELKDNVFSLQRYQPFFQCSLELLKAKVAALLSEYTFYIRDTEKINFLIHLAIAMERVAAGEVLPSTISIDETSEEYQLAQAIGRMLEQHFQRQLPPSELHYVAFLLSGKKVIGGTPQGRLAQYQAMPPWYRAVTERILQAILAEFGLDFRGDANLMVGLTLHLQLMHERVKRRNPVKQLSAPDLKSNYPIVFEIAVFAYKRFYEEVGLPLTDWQESEISFIALHFGASYEACFKQGTPLRVALVCPSGYTTSQLLKEKLRRTYGDALVIVDTYSLAELDHLKQTAVDYVFSTLDLGPLFPLPFIVISSFLSSADFRNIYQVLSREVRKQDRDIERYFEERFFFRLASFADAREAIHYLSRQLIEAGVVDEEYEQLVWEREELASTAFSQLFALPHAMKLTAHKTVFAVALLQKPMQWQGQAVQLILLSAIKPGERKTLNHFMSYMAEVLDNPIQVKQLIACRSYEEFITRLTM